MYGSGLVPRRATWLGLIGGPLIIVSGTVIMFGGNHPSHALHSLQAIVTIPEFAWELFLGVYCTIWGFRRDAPILSGSARCRLNPSRRRTPKMPRPTLSHRRGRLCSTARSADPSERP
jgi:peptidoglycan/LPS O-acetylase OafA/YrhL